MPVFLEKANNPIAPNQDYTLVMETNLTLHIELRNKFQLIPHLISYIMTDFERGLREH